MTLFFVLLLSLLLGHYPNVLVYLQLGFFPKIYLFDLVVFFIFLKSLLLRKYRNKKVDFSVLLFLVLNLVLILLNTKLLFSFGAFFIYSAWEYICSHTHISSIYSKPIQKGF